MAICVRNLALVCLSCNKMRNFAPFRMVPDGAVVGRAIEVVGVGVVRMIHFELGQSKGERDWGEKRGTTKIDICGRLDRSPGTYILSSNPCYKLCSKFGITLSHNLIPDSLKLTFVHPNPFRTATNPHHRACNARKTQRTDGRLCGLGTSTLQPCCTHQSALRAGNFNPLPLPLLTVLCCTTFTHEHALVLLLTPAKTHKTEKFKERNPFLGLCNLAYFELCVG